MKLGYGDDWHSTGPLWGDSTGNWWFPSQRDKNVETVSISRHIWTHELTLVLSSSPLFLVSFLPFTFFPFSVYFFSWYHFSCCLFLYIFFCYFYSNAYMYHEDINEGLQLDWNPLTHRGWVLTRPSLVQIMAWRLVNAKPLSETMLEYC